MLTRIVSMQVLIFVHSRKETAKTALYLKQTALDNDHLAKFMRDDSASREILQVCYVYIHCCSSAVLTL
jgi:replicative superfamily II helicase